MKKIYLILPCLISMIAVFNGCKEAVQPSPSKNFISGKFENLTGTERILLQRLSAQQNEILTLDTIIPDMDGNYEIAPNIEGLTFYRIFIANNNYFNFITQPAETLKISASVDDLEGTYTVEGSEETDVLTSFNGIMNDYVDLMDSLRIEMQNAQATRNAQLGQQIYDFQVRKNAEVGNQVRDFIRTNSNKFAVLSALQQFDPEADMELYEVVLNDLAEKAGENDIYIGLKNRMDIARQLMPGAVLPDLISKNFKGEDVKLSETLGEKYTLVDFWASWCRPCRAENPIVVRAYDRYNGDGFEIFGVSLDKDANQWVAAVEQDGLKWTQVSDLLFWDSPSAKQYNIQSIPANFLIDSEMRIVAKNLRGAELEAKLGELIGG